MSSPSPAVSPELAREIENAAVEMAWGAGDILSRSFRSQLTIEYKDKNNLDPVTSADKETQQYLANAISARFPGHGILGEETSGEDESDDPSPDFLWVLDPLDGTTNFLNGLPVYASSIGVLHRGRPQAGALYLPWPNTDGGLVLHCRRGNGCFANDDPVEVFATEKPVGNRLVGVPGFFPVTTRVRQDWKGSLGEPRTTGSIAYELAMTAMGAMQYAVFGAPRMWDMLGGAIAVQEAKGDRHDEIPRGKIPGTPSTPSSPPGTKSPPASRNSAAGSPPLCGRQRRPRPPHRPQPPPPLPAPQSRPNAWRGGCGARKAEASPPGAGSPARSWVRACPNAQPSRQAPGGSMGAGTGLTRTTRTSTSVEALVAARSSAR